MKKSIILLLGIVLLASCATLKPYDSNEVKMAMQTILSAAKTISGALEANDLSSAPMEFMVLKEQFLNLSRMEAPKGSLEEWKMTHEKMTSLAMDGKEAAEMGDVELVGSILGKIFEMQKNGHGTFKD